MSKNPIGMSIIIFTFYGYRNWTSGNEVIAGSYSVHHLQNQSFSSSLIYSNFWVFPPYYYKFPYNSFPGPSPHQSFDLTLSFLSSLSFSHLLSDPCIKIFNPQLAEWALLGIKEKVNWVNNILRGEWLISTTTTAVVHLTRYLCTIGSSRGSSRARSSHPTV